MEIFSSIFFFIVALGILVTVHEFGHFWVARRLGVKVLRFSVGFGKALWARRSGADQTEYVIAAVPLGGYVKMLDEAEGVVPKNELHRAFNRKPLGRRAAIVAAGPVFNLILAILLYWLVFIIGAPGLRPVVGEVTPDSVAAQGGFTAGDEIVRVGSEPTPTWDRVIIAILESTMARETVEVGVRDTQGREETRVLDLSAISTGTGQGKLLESLGLSIAKLRVPAVIDSIVPGGAADEAGLVAGDRIVSVDGQPVEDWDFWVSYVRAHPEKAMSVSVERQGVVFDLTLTPAAVETPTGVVGQIGALVRVPPEVREQMRVLIKLGPLDALGAALTKSWDMFVLTLKLLGNMVVGDVSIANISGPISIAQYAGYSASVGVASFFSFLAVISISLGILNLLPVPVLDGGHLLYYLIEYIRGRPLSEQAQMIGQQIGIVLLMSLMAVAFYNDILRLLN